jgi:ribosomal RNA-processing protein 36
MSEYESSSDYNEEEKLQDQVEEMEFGKLLKAQKRLEILNKKDVKKINKNELKQKFEQINTGKSKGEPREFSAKIKPMKSFEESKKPFRRDPRFDNISGEYNEDMFKQNFSFVNEDASTYIDKIKNLKKGKKKLDETTYKLMQNQINIVKGWMKTNKSKEIEKNIEKEIKEENKTRIEKGLNPIYLKDKQKKELIKAVKSEKRTEDENKRFLKRKKHKETQKMKKMDKQNRL